MKKEPLTCPVCHKKIDLSVDEYECVQITGRSCHPVDIRSVSADTHGVICFVHPDHHEVLVYMVRAGVYPAPQEAA